MMLETFILPVHFDGVGARTKQKQWVLKHNSSL